MREASQTSEMGGPGDPERRVGEACNPACGLLKPKLASSSALLLLEYVLLYLKKGNIHRLTRHGNSVFPLTFTATLLPQL